MRAIRRIKRRRMIARAKREYYWLPLANVVRMAETSVTRSDRFRMRVSPSERIAKIELREALDSSDAID